MAGRGLQHFILKATASPITGYPKGQQIVSFILELLFLKFLRLNAPRYSFIFFSLCMLLQLEIHGLRNTVVPL